MLIKFVSFDNVTQDIHTRGWRGAGRYSAAAADASFGLILCSYSDRPNKSEQHEFIHLSLPSASGI